MTMAPESSGCPSIETLCSWILGTAASRRAETVAAHVKTCETCQREVESARAFLADEDRPVPDEGALRQVLERTEPFLIELSRTLRPRPRLLRRIVPALVTGVAAAAVVLLVVRPFDVARAPDVRIHPDSDRRVRGAEIVLTHPAGAEGGFSREFAWEAVDGAAGYRFVILDVLDEPVYSTRVEKPRAVLPGDLELDPTTRYAWRVEALNGAGELLRSSTMASFVTPGAGAREETPNE